MPEIEEIDIARAKKFIEQGDITIVDIRDPSDYKNSCIPNAISLNKKNISEFLKTVDKNQPLLCYCYHGISSRSAADYFSNQGFRKTYSLIGGFEKWRSSYPAESA